ncbi:MAG: peptidyl-prolyl cis-trans isomerase, partial [Calditrichaeota bacterium]|nr:peptidyl-prolyl cis-trans isomerase [Calditrichota bacterium]
WSCSREKPDPEARIVARVGDKTITVREFRRNYEAGFAHLKTGPDRKRTYLDYMIKEELLALEGYRRGFDQSESVQNAQAKLLNELMVEALIEREVKSKITVSMDEIKDAINKSKVSFKFRYWPESSREKAQQIAAAMRERGYAEVVDEQLRNNPERQINPQDFETDYKNWMEVSPEVLEAIKDLPYGDISDPVEIDGQYLVFQVLDIRRQGVTTNEYIGKASTFEQMVYYRKLQEAVTRYVSDLMSPKNVVTRGESMKLLANAVLEWHQRG